MKCQPIAASRHSTLGRTGRLWAHASTIDLSGGKIADWTIAQVGTDRQAADAPMAFTKITFKRQAS